uniref:Rabphilin n=1 Tax=Photinus pyralis TaxID=7054 RepID=A0A1Y1LN07_PHOPY
MVDLGFGTGGSRFVCPNDRQLALRAKLKTGWSVKTSTFGYKSSPAPLRDDEQTAILEVIRRAEQLDIVEQERVGKLIERLENMRRNVLGRSTSQCLLCGDRFGILGSQKARCVDCQRFVCQKCSIETISSGKQRCAGKESCLCMICSETREIWKKSGAWFFKSLPKYTLPNQSYGTNKSSLRNSRRYKNYDDDSSSDEDARLWERIQSNRRGSNTESMHDAAEVLSQSLPKSFSRQTSAIDTQAFKEDHPLREHLSTLTLDETKAWEDQACENSGNSSQASKESFASELNWADSRTEGKRSSSICSISSSIFKTSNEERKVDSSVGTMELALTYDPVNLTLHCSVYRAKNLIAMDINGLADPFCKLNILPDAKTYTRLRTKTVHKSRNPEFNENLTFYEINEKDLSTKSLHVLVLDDDKYGHDYMGEANIPLAKLRVQNTVYLCVPLEMLRAEQKGPPLSPDLNQWLDDLWLRGQILLSLCYSTKKRALLVGVVKCTNLLPMDNNGYSDPFVKLHLKPDPYHKKHKTTIKWKNLNPIFNEEFAFETRLTELSTQSLHITVWDKDYGKSNDYLGGLVLGGLGSKGQRLKHWLDMIHYPDHRHESWHNLTEDTTLLD